MATLRQVQRAIELHQDELVQYPNVTGLGVVPAKDAESSGDSEVAVYVTKKVPRAELKPDERIPSTLQIPARKGTHEVGTRIIIKGEFQLEE
jgi:hypothetical protein